LEDTQEDKTAGKAMGYHPRKYMILYITPRVDMTRLKMSKLLVTAED